jgi:hypothetical protein
VRRLAFFLLAFTALVACRSRVIQVTLQNSSAQAISTIIVDYPKATFGVNSLAPGQKYLYKIKPLDTGPLKLQFTDAQGGSHSFVGPALHRNQEGSIEITLTQQSMKVQPALR